MSCAFLKCPVKQRLCHWDPYSEKQFSYLHFFNFPATPLHSSTISSCPQRRFQDKNVWHILKMCLTLGNEKPINFIQIQNFCAVKSYPLASPCLFSMKKEKQILPLQKATKCFSSINFNTQDLIKISVCMQCWSHSSTQHDFPWLPVQRRLSYRKASADDNICQPQYEQITRSLQQRGVREILLSTFL